jgi:hypothetical protein
LLTGLFSSVSRELSRNLNPVSAAASGNALYGQLLQFCSTMLPRRETPASSPDRETPALEGLDCLRLTTFDDKTWTVMSGVTLCHMGGHHPADLLAGQG